MDAQATDKLLQVPMSNKMPLVSEGLGVPSRIRRFTWMDFAAVVVVLLAFVFGLITVMYRPTSVSLGQKNQLILLGLMLSIMGSCTQGRIQKLSLTYEARAGDSTLQNFDAILRTDHFSQAASLRPRIVLLSLFALPLGLSSSYKTFVDGSTTIRITSTDAKFGLTAAPGYQLIGNGLSLLVDSYLPFWIQPSLNRTYGFNLYVANNTTAAILDAPLPNDILKIQASLNDYESMNMTAEVNATVTENIDPSSAQRIDYDGYWRQKESLYHDVSNGTGTSKGAWQGMWAGTGQDTIFGNNTEIFLSLYNTTKNQSFYSEAERFVSTRRTCVGVWSITRHNVSLVSVANLQPADTIRATQKQTVITGAANSIKSMFAQFLGEYDWKTRQSWVQPLPGSYQGEPPQLQYNPVFNTRPALVATMIWARVTSNYGPERPVVDAHISPFTSYSKRASDIILVKRAITLQRSPLLIVVLAIHPILTISAVLAKATLYATPIGDGFGLISLLAGIREEGFEVLRGAALSGILSEKVRVRFTAGKEAGLNYERILLDLGSRAKSDRLDPKVRYG